MEAGPHARVKHGCAAEAVQYRTRAPAASLESRVPAPSHVPPPLLAVFARAPGPAVGAQAFAAAVAAEAPNAVMLTDVGPPQSLQLLLMQLCSQMPAPPQSLRYTYSSRGYARRCWCPRSPCIGSCCGYATDAGAPAVLALAPDAVMLADAGTPADDDDDDLLFVLAENNK